MGKIAVDTTTAVCSIAGYFVVSDGGRGFDETIYPATKIRFIILNYTPLINIGCGIDRTIKEIAAIVAEVVGYKGDVRWDQDKPDGTPQKLLDISKIEKLGWKPSIDLKDGIQSVYEWYLKGII